jgi:hypothetical protein
MQFKPVLNLLYCIIMNKALRRLVVSDIIIIYKRAESQDLANEKGLGVR